MGAAKQVKAGSVLIGGGAPVSIQSMTNTDTRDVPATLDQIKRLAVVGCHAVTITPETFDMLIAHPSTDVSMQGFDRAWREKFGDREITDFLP